MMNGIGGIQVAQAMVFACASFLNRRIRGDKKFALPNGGGHREQHRLFFFLVPFKATATVFSSQCLAPCLYASSCVSFASRVRRLWRGLLLAVLCLALLTGVAHGQTVDPEISAHPPMRGGKILEGQHFHFGVNINELVAVSLPFTYQVVHTGDFLFLDSRFPKNLLFTGDFKNVRSYLQAFATVNDAVDKPNGTLTVTLQSGSGYDIPPGKSTATWDLIDNDPTSVTLAVPTTDLEEGSAGRNLTVTLGRALVQGETLTVPLIFSGQANSQVDYTLAQPISVPMGASYSNLTSTNMNTPPSITFTGPSAVSAAVVLTATTDSVNEGAGETVEVSLGSLATTNLGGGARGSGSGTFTITDAAQQAQQDEIPRFFTSSLNLEDPVQANAKVIEMVKAMIVRHRDVTGNKNALAKWRKALKTLKGKRGGFTVAQLENQVARLSGTPKKRWQLVLEAVKAIQAGTGSSVSGTPIVGVSGGSAVTEGSKAEFTVEADSAPASNLAVTVTVRQTGSYVASAALGKQTVTIPAGKTSAAFTVATQKNDVNEADGSVTADLEAGSGYTVGGKPSASVRVRDDDAIAVTLASQRSNMPEDGQNGLKITLGRSLVKGEKLAVPLVFGGTASAQHDYYLNSVVIPYGVKYTNLSGAGTPTITFTGPSAQYAYVVVYGKFDNTDEGAHETVTVALGTLKATGLSGGVKGSGNVSFNILEPSPQVTVTSIASSVTEGNDAAFKVTADRAPEADLAVRLTVSEAEGGDFIAADDEGVATVTIAKGKTEALFSVPTANDGKEESDGTVKVTLLASDSEDNLYRVAPAPKNTASITVADDDTVVTAAPSFSISDVTGNERNTLMYFTVTLKPAANKAVSVAYRTRESNPVSARQNQDYMKKEWSMSFAPGQTEKRFWVYIFNDSHDEDPETFEIQLYNARGAAIADAVAVGTIVNNDPMPKAWLSRFGRAAAEQALDGISARIAAPRTAGVQGSVAGQAFNVEGAANDSVSFTALADQQFMPSNHSHGFASQESQLRLNGLDTGLDSRTYAFDRTEHRVMNGREALMGSSFSATESKDSSGGALAYWGRAAQSDFDGKEGAFSLDGETTTVMLGMDYMRNESLLGFAVMQSDGKGDYSDSGTGSARCAQPLDAQTRTVLCSGAVREGDGKVEASLTAWVPYAAYQASQRVNLWGAAGFGSGQVKLKPSVGAKSYKSDIDWKMFAAGVRGDLLSAPDQGSGAALTLTSDVLSAHTSSKKTADLAAGESKVNRLRIGLESTWRVVTEDGGSLVSKLTLGARHDGGDAETGSGLELGGGFSWQDPTLGISLDMDGRSLISHSSDDFKDRGYAVSFVFDPDRTTQRGPSFSLRQQWGGQATNGLESLFDAAPLGKRAENSEARSRWTMEMAYGYSVLGGQFVSAPHVGFGYASDIRDYSIGWRLTPELHAPNLSLSLKAVRRQSEGNESQDSVRFEISSRW